MPAVEPCSWGSHLHAQYTGLKACVLMQSHHGQVSGSVLMMILM